MSLIDEYSELQKKKNGGQRSRSSLLQEHIEKNGTSGLNERYVETALQNGGGFGFTQVSKATPIAQNANEYESSTHNSGLYNTTMSAAEYQKEIERITGERKKVSGNYDYAVANVAGKQRSGRSSKEEIKAAQEEVDAYKKQLADLDRQLEEMKSGKWAAEGEAKYSSIPSNADYAEKSKIIDDSKARGFGITIGDKYFGTGDDVYAYINDIDGRQSDMKVAVNGSTGEAGLQKYKYMTQREKDNYNYIYQTEGKKAANKYLAYISYDLDARRTQKVGEWQADFAEDHPYISSAATVGPNQMSIIGLVDVAGQNISRNISGEYKPINYNSPGMDATRMTTTIRSTVSQNLADEYGTINLDSEEHPVLSRVLNGKNWGDVYQLGMSMADSASTAALGKFTGIGAAGTVLLGGSAGSQGVLTALDKGATDEQALAMGILNGTFEALFEYVSLDNLLKGDTKNILTSFFKQGFIEGTEELGTTLANTIADICVMAEKSDYKSGVQAYMDAGYSQQEAERMAMQDIAIGMGWDFVGGAISGGIMGGGKATVNKYIIEPYNYRKVYGENVQELVNESQEINPGNELAQDIQGKIDRNKRVSGLKIRNLVNQNEADMRSNDKAVIQAAVAKQLESYGETGNIAAIAQAITNHVAGERLTQADRRLIFQSRYGQRVANELNPENIRSGEYATEWAENLNTHRINAGEYSRMLQESETEDDSVSTERQAMTENVQKAQPAAQQETVQEPDTPVGKMEVTADENISNAKGKTANAQVSVDDASKKYGAQSIAFIRTYQNGQDVRQYDEAYSSAYEYGKSSVPFDVVKDLDSVSYLTEAQREIAYEAGVAASVSEADAKQQDRMQKANGKTGRRKGAVKLEGAPASSLNEQQKRATRVLRTVAEATGIDIVLTRSEIGEDGKYEGAQGAFKHASPDKIYIDLNAGLLEGKDASDLAKYAMLRTFSHEFIHFVEYWNPVQYNEFRKVVFNEITARGENVNDLIETKMEKTGLSYEKASREVVAEAMTDILPDSKFVQNMAENHKSLFDKLLEKLKEFAADIREYFSNIGANRDAGAKALKEQIGETVKYLDSIIDMFDTAATEAVETFQKAYAVDETEQVADKLENAEASTVSEETETAEAEAAQVKPEPKTTTSEHGYTVTDNTEYGSVEVKFDDKPAESVRDVLKANKFRWNKAKKVWYGKTSHDAIVDALNKAYEAEQAPAPVDTKPTEETPKSDFAKVWESATQEAKDEIIQAIYENTKISHMAPTEVRETPPVYSATKETPVNADVSIDYSKTNEIAKKIIKQTKKGMNTYTFTAKVGNSYIAGNSFVVSVVDLDTFKSLFETVAKPAIDGNALEQIVNNKDYTKFTGKAYSYLNNSGYTSQIKSVLLESAKDQILINEKYAKYFDGYDFYHIPGKKNLPILIKDLNGNTIGIVMPMRIDKPINTEKLDTSKMKSFRNAQENVEEIKEEKKNGGKNKADKGTIQQSESDGDGATRILEEVQAGDVQRAGGQRETVASAEERGGQAGRDSDREPAHTGDSGSEGTGQSGNLRRDDGVNQEEAQAKAEKLKETVAEQIKQQSTEAPKGSNFIIGESINLPTGEKARFRANTDAIKLIKQLEDEGRYATAAEQEILSKYVGWGGLSNAFGELKYNRELRKSEMVAKPGWEKEFSELRKLVADGILTEEEYNAMSASTKNAHYTSIEVIKAMYDGLAQLGFTGGRMLEPSSGVGNFVGGMPASMSRNVKSWTMVELDRITGQIAKYLYPHADVRIQGFETANIPDNYMDVAIGNVPFGNYGVVDSRYPKRITKAIHNYFFAKTLDKVRTGGVVMFITSSFTMNSQNNAIRQYIMDRADLLGAIRLPNTAFSGNAGTEVVTDILVLKKRAAGTEYAGEPFLEAPYRNIGDSWQGANVNEYFDNHPEMVLGTAALERGMYGANSLTYNPLEGNGTLGDQIREAFKNITGKMDYKAQASPEKANFAVERANKKTKQFGLEVKDGEVYRNIDGHLEVVSSDKATADRVTGLLGVRDAYRTLVNYLQQGQDAKYVKQARKALNKAYDDFAKKYGPINSAKNRSTIADDPDRYSLLSLENYDAKNKTATKADIFTKDTISANKTVRHVDDVATGVIVSINRTGGIDASLIAKITGKTEEDITRELIDSRMAFKTKDGGLEAPETYLSGNVRAKLREAEALAPLDKDFQNNVEELKKVIPQDIPFNDIFTAVGTPWIPNSVYADFIAEMLGGHNSETSYSGPDVTVGRTNTGDFKIVVNNARLRSRYQNTQKWGTRRKSFLDLMQSLMSSTSITVNDYIEDADGRRKSVINKVETAAAQEKAEEISKEFQEWLWRDENRRKELSSLYNETFNALVTPKYNGTNLTINGLNAEFSLREHQANAVQRIISSGGNTLLAHKVGAGKTLEMAAAAMKLRELGVVKKPVFVVPKALVAQWGVEFKNYFPAARLLVSDEKSFTKANRKVFSNRIANGDYDAVILSYEQFEKIPMSNAYLQDFYQQQINEIIDAIAEEKAESRDGKGLTVKEMEKKKAQLEKKIAELTSKPKDEDNIDFEQLGIDSLFVDEAHNFKNLQYVTRMNNISGLGNTNGSQRAFDLFTKVRYLQGLNGGRGIVFATATPVMNSMAEMYIMQKYLQSDMLEQLGLKTFDAWAKQFGEVVNSVEIKPSGQGFRVKQTFSNFRNLNELQMLFRSFSDVLTDVPGLKIPKMKGGKVKTVVCEPGQFQKDYMAELEKRADNVKNVDPSEDNMLKITSDGRKVSYTQRMIDPTLPYEPGCKIYRCCDNVLSEYRASSKIKGTQIIFCDMATPKGKSKAASTDEADDTELDTSSAKLYEDMKAYLVKRGIPAKEIAFIHDADTDVKKKQLFADVNDGKVRVLIGSTGKMGVGMNAQKRIVAIHHLDAPWRPGDVEQRDGRAFRQKNMNEEVSKYTYVTEGSFDARLWDILDRKQHFINQIMNGEDVGRSAEDTGDVTLSAAEVKALASGNPMIMEQVQLSTDLSKLQDLRRAYNSSITAAKAKLLEDEQKIKTLEGSISNLADDINARVDTYSDGKFSMTIGNKTFTEKKDAGTALSAAIVAKAKQGEFVNVGKFAGFELRVMKDGAEYTGLISGKQGYKFNIYVENTTYMVNHIIGVIDGFETRKKNWMERLADLRTDRDAQETIIAAPFAKQAELEQKTARFNEVMAILNPKEEQVIGDEQEQSRAYLDSSEPIVKGMSDEERYEILKDRIISLDAKTQTDEIRTQAPVNQAISSAKTSIKQIPALFKDKNVHFVETNVDIGGGRFDLATEFLAQRGVKNYLFDPYNRPEDVNMSTLSFLQSGNRADTATCANVLNVIAEHAARANVILEAAKAIKRDGTAYFMVYEGDGSGVGRETSSGWQNNRKTADYVSEIAQYFGNVARKGKLIIATEPHSNLPKASWEISPGNAIQYQQRTSPLTDREVLSIAAKEISVEGLTDGEIDALRIFDERLNKLYELEQRRVEEGRKYKEQQFGANVDRAEAQKTLNRMKILDSQIKRASESVLDVEKKEVLKRVLQKARKVVEANERAKGQELLKRYRDRRNNAAEIKKYRERIKADTDSLKKWILHPDNKSAYRHVPDTLKNSIIPFLTSIDFTSKQQLKGGDATKADKEFMKNIKALRDSIKQNIDVHGMYSGYNDLPDGFIDEMQEFIDSARVLSESQQGQFVINRMTSEELKTLSKLVRVVKKLIINMNAFHQNAMFQHAYEAGDNSIDFLRKIGNAKNTGTVSEFLLWQQMRPAYAFERFGKGGKSIYDEFRRGQATLAFNTNKIKEFAESAYSEDEVKAWEKETKTFTLGGDTVKIPVSYIMGFYELSKQKDSLEHILGEGIRVATYTTKNGKRKEKISDVGHALTPGDVSTMIKSLTQRQMEVADSLQKFMASQGAAWGNYVSVARFGEELFTNPQYYPINSDGRHLEATADEHPSAASLYALLNMSFTKSRKEGANNRIVLYSIFDVFSNHMASMAQYNAFALPILDSLKWFNYQQVEKNEDGSKTILGSVREEMARVYGTPEENRPGSGRKGYAENFVINIIKAFNGTETQGVPTDTQGINALHKYNMAQVAYNFRVVVQQPMSITRAGMLVDYKNIIKGLRLSPADIKSNIAEMRKYSGIAAWKSLGFYDVNISRGLADIIKHNKTAMDKIGDAGMWGAEKADLITWSAIWSACKEQVRRDQHMKPSDEGFYDAVTNLFEDVIYKTQVVDSVLTKNEFMRSKGAWARLIGSFMSEPTTTASMLIDAYDKYSMDMQRGFSRQQAWKNNGKYIVRTAYVYGIGAILLAAVQAIPDAFRDDDDYETWLEKWLEAFGGNLVDELMPLNKLPILRDFYELIKSLLATFGVDTYGNEPRSVIFQWRDYLVKSSEIFHDKIVGEDTNYTWYGGAYKLLQAASGIAGLPMAAVTRELCAAWNAVVGAMAPSLKVKTYDAGDKANIKYAYQDGYLTDDEAVEKLMNGKDSNGDPLFTDRKKAIKEVTKWKCKVETGIDNEDLKNAYNSGKITYNEAIEYIMKYRGKTWDEAVKQIKQWGE